MTEGDVAAILRRLDNIDASHVEIKTELVALKAWQTTRVQADHDRQVKLDTYRGLYRWAFRAYQSNAVRWLAVPLGIMIWNRMQ